MDPQISDHPVTPDTRELPLNAEIARQAYDLWEKYGRPHGCDLDIWLEAERQLLGADAKVNRHSGAAVLAKPLEDAVYTPPAASPTQAIPPPRTVTSSQPTRRR